MLSDFQKRKLARRFQLFDRRRKGRIRWQDFEAVLESVLEISDWANDAEQRNAFYMQGRTGWQLLVAAADVNFDGEVDLEEWYAFYAGFIYPKSGRPGLVPDWLASLSDLSFSVMDTNNDDEISLAEYQALAQAHGMPLDGLADQFGRIDTNSDGKISRREWKQLNDDYYLGDDPLSASAWLWGDVFNTLFK